MVTEQSCFKQFPSDTKRGYGVEIVIIMEDVSALYETAKSFAKIVDPLIMQPWGIKDFRLKDPFGYYVRLTEPHDILDKEYAVE